MLHKPVQNRRLTAVVFRHSFSFQIEQIFFNLRKLSEFWVKIGPPYICKRAAATGASHIAQICLVLSLKLIQDAARKNTDLLVFEPTTMNFRDFWKTSFNTLQTIFLIKTNIIMRFSNKIIEKSVKLKA